MDGVQAWLDAVRLGLVAQRAASLQLAARGARPGRAAYRGCLVLRAVDAMRLAVTTPPCSFHTAPAQSAFMLAKALAGLAFQKRAAY